MKKLSWHGVAQTLSWAIQVVNVSALPPKYQPMVASIIGFLQLLLHQYAFNQQPPAK